MKKVLITCFAAAGIALAGCTSTPGDIAAQIAAVQKTAMQVCGFLPYATTIANIFAKNVAGLKTAEEVAKSICDAMTPVKANKAAPAKPPEVGGVPVEGDFVKPDDQ